MTLDKIKNIAETILKRHGISKAGIFGSYAYGAYNQFSDVDILVEIKKRMSLLEFIKIKNELEDNLGKKVDLVEYDMINPAVKESILSEEKRIYG